MPRSNLPINGQVRLRHISLEVSYINHNSQGLEITVYTVCLLDILKLLILHSGSFSIDG